MTATKQQQTNKTATTTTSQSSTPNLDRAVEFTPVGQDKPVRVTIQQVTDLLAVKSKSGATPTKSDVVVFLMQCKARGLDPWTKDVYLVGYDNWYKGKMTGTNWTIITTHQAYLNRAESNPQYDGKESGVSYVIDETDEPKEIAGEVIPRDATLTGGWCKIYRKDRSRPDYASVNLYAYNSGLRYGTDPAGMILKTTECKAIRSAFPFPKLKGAEDFNVQLAEADVVDAAAEISARTKTVAAHVAANAQPPEDHNPDAVLDQSPPDIDWHWLEDHLGTVMTEKKLDDLRKELCDDHPHQRQAIYDRCNEHLELIREQDAAKVAAKKGKK